MAPPNLLHHAFDMSQGRIRAILSVDKSGAKCCEPQTDIAEGRKALSGNYKYSAKGESHSNGSGSSKVSCENEI
jgi:hypothetical protein